jgi:hypothetical protein
MFRTTTSGFTIVHILLIRTFGGKNIENVRGGFGMQLDRVRKARNRKEDVNE